MPLQIAKCYIDDSSPANFMGMYVGDHGITIPGTWAIIESPPPQHGSQTTTDGGQTWSVFPPV